MLIAHRITLLLGEMLVIGDNDFADRAIQRT